MPHWCAQQQPWGLMALAEPSASPCLTLMAAEITWMAAAAAAALAITATAKASSGVPCLSNTVQPLRDAISGTRLIAQGKAMLFTMERESEHCAQKRCLLSRKRNVLPSFNG